MDLTELLGPPTRRAEVASGDLDLWLQPGLLVGQMSGHVSRQAAAAMIEATDEVIALSAEPVVVLHDWLALRSYDIAAQAQLSTYSLRRLKHLRRVVIAVASPLVSMGVKTANVVVRGQLEVTNTSLGFEMALREEISRLPRHDGSP